MNRQRHEAARRRGGKTGKSFWSRFLVVTVAALAAFVSRARAQNETMIAVSADIVEISGSISRNTGFNWAVFGTGINFGEKGPFPTPSILKIGDFQRQTQLLTMLQFLETEGKAQTLSNPKVITKSGTQANFLVGGDQPYPVTTNQGVGVEFHKFGVILNILPAVNPNKKDSIDAQLQLEVSNPDFSKPVQVGGTSVPTMTTRQVQTEVEIKSGETLVIGGLKSSNKNVTKTRIPFLGRIPILGLLFTTTSVIEEQKSLFLFVTFEIVK